MCDSKVLTIGAINFVKIAGNKFGGTTAGRDDGSTWVFRFVDFGYKVNTRSSMSGNGETFCRGRQFLISYKSVKRVVDNALIQRLVLYFRNLHLFHSNTIKT